MISKKEFEKLEKIYGQHNEGCKCDVCQAVQEYYDFHHNDTDSHPEFNRELRFS